MKGNIHSLDGVREENKKRDYINLVLSEFDKLERDEKRAFAQKVYEIERAGRKRL
jgi:hypothetical protein